MFARFRQTKTSLQVSIIETRRRKHEHVASLGAVKQPLSVEDRIAFWKRVHERLARLGNRLDAAAQAKVLAAVHLRVPMGVRRAVLRAHARLARVLEGQKGLAATVERSIEDRQAGMAAAAANRKRGEGTPRAPAARRGRAWLREKAQRRRAAISWIKDGWNVKKRCESNDFRRQRLGPPRQLRKLRTLIISMQITSMRRAGGGFQHGFAPFALQR
jgi:hypothetical protein